jgi:ribosomal protein S18 acetylase RimI-like enzyme
LLVDDAPVRSAEDSWQHARREYREWLDDGAAILLLARNAGSSRLVGYLLCRLLEGGPTFDLGELRGEIDSLVVDDQSRGQGVGTALLEAARADLDSRGVSYWSIGVLAQNAEAARLYERLGFRPWTQQLLASVRAPLDATRGRG